MDPLLGPQQLPNGRIPFGDEANCTLSTCPLEASILQYQPSQPANGTFLGIFAILLILHFAQGARTRSWGFAFCMVCGCILEIAGYIGRLIIHDNPFSFEGFITQIVCITIAPVFFCSAIYVVLSQVIEFTDKSVSRFRPQLFYWVFIPCDIISLVLQSAGGALSCLSDTADAIQQGVDISLSGLIFQVITLVVFIVLFADYLVAVRRSASWGGKVDKRMKVFLTFLFLSILFILVRCAYRIVELREGYFSEFFRDEPLFIALESAIMCVAVTCLIIGHPGPIFNKDKKRKLCKDEKTIESGNASAEDA